MSDTRPFSVNDLLALRIASEVSAGPGERIAYAVREADLEESYYRTHVWSVSPGAEPVQLTRGDKSCWAPAWAPDGRHLAFISSRPDGKYSDNGPRSQVWLLPAAGGEAFCLTKAAESVRTYQWAPDGSAVFYLTEEPESDATKARKAREKRQKMDAVVEHDIRRRHQLWKVAAQLGAEAKLVYEGDPGLSEIAVSPDGASVAFTTNYTGLADDYQKYDLWVLELESARTRQLTTGLGGVWAIGWSPDASRIRFGAPHDPRYSYSRHELFIVPAAGGAVANLCALNPAFRGDVFDAFFVDDRQMVIVAAEGCYSHIYRLDTETGALEPLGPTDVAIGSVSLTPDRRYFAFLCEGPHSVPDLFLLDLQNAGEPQRLTDINPKMQTDFDWAEQQVIRWQSDNGLEIEGILTLPPGHREGDRHPLAVYVHGGPHGRVSNQLRQYTNWQVLAAEGYAVLAPNYRGSLGYGHDFAVANRGDLGGGDYRDIMTGADHVIATGVADGDRMAILGGSYGGFMTNWSVGQTDRFKAAVSMFGIFNLMTDYSQSEMPGWELGYLEGYWWENPEPYSRCSPSTYLPNIKTPVLIIHGDADTNTNPANSREMYQALRHMGRTVQYVHYPREGHGLTEPNHKKDEYRRVLEWFSKYVLGQGERAAGTVVKDGHRLEVAAVERVESYSGRTPKGRYLALSVRVTPAKGSLKLDLSEARLVADSSAVKWETGLAGVAAGLVLVPASGTVEIGSPVAITLVFDVPAKAPPGDWRLVTAAFPEVVVAL